MATTPSPRNPPLRLVTWLCRVTQKQTALPSYWVRQSRRAVRCAAEPRNEFLGRSVAVPAKAGKDLSFIDTAQNDPNGAF